MKLSHINSKNEAHMVDISDKSITKRIAVASGIITMSEETFKYIVLEKSHKGPIISTAIVACISGVKKTYELIPMAHILNISGVNCEITPLPSKDGFKVTVVVKNEGKTGVEMEALTGVSIALLTIYDMSKSVSKDMVISDIKLDSKDGGVNGSFKRENYAK